MEEKIRIPKVIFKCSRIYDEQWKKINEFLEKGEYPSLEETEKYREEIDPLWREKEVEVLTELSRATGLSWEMKYISCYVVGKAFPFPAFSDPLTISVYKREKDLFIDTLVHELIHQLFIQPKNFEKLNERSKILGEKYPKESLRTRIHISLHAVHKHIYLQLFNESRLKRDIERAQSKVDYKRAWDIVQKEGYENIIKELKYE